MMEREILRAMALVLLCAPALIYACGDEGDATGAQAASASSGGAGSGGGSAGSAACELGSSWSVVDDFVFSPGEPSNPNAVPQP